MKVHVLRVDPALQPADQPFRYPAHNRDYGVEQDMLAWLQCHPGLLTDNPRAADWHYLPVFWTRWHLHHSYGKTGRDELAALIDGALLNDERTFTVCQNDDGPLVDLGRAQIMLASRRGSDGIDIPLLSDPHRRPRLPVRRRWLASFVGRVRTHPLRAELAEKLAGRSDVRIVDSEQGTRAFVRATLAADITLSPRGYGGSSFRFFEAAQLGRVPMLIGERDTRPFHSAIDWSRISLYAADPATAVALLDGADRSDLRAMGEEAARVWANDLTYARWCQHALDELPHR